MAASREKVLYFEPQPSEQTAALKTVFVRMGVRIKNVEAVSAARALSRRTRLQMRLPHR